MSPPSMMVPRAYTYTSEKKARGPVTRQRPEAEASARSRVGRDGDKTDKSLGVQRVRRDGDKTDKSLDVQRARNPGLTSKDVPGIPKRISSISHSTPSQPVIIPTRTAAPKKPRNDSTTTGSPARDIPHDSTALPPSVASLLAMTSISPSRSRTMKGETRNQLIPNAARRSASSTSPRSWSILQSAPEDLDIDPGKDEFDVEIGSIVSRSTLDAEGSAIYRTLSSDSMPSLDMDGETFNSPESPPIRTPSSRRARSPRREKPKTSSTSEPLAVGELHPLALNEVLEQDEQEPTAIGSESSRGSSPMELLASRDSSPSRSKPSHFRSNLTASLQRLKNAARSISLPTPSVSTILAINSRVLPEQKPLPRPRSPLPLNNSAFSHKTLNYLTREEKTNVPLASELYFSSTPSEEYRAIASSIQLQTYLRRDETLDPLLDRATAPPIFLSSSPAPPILLPGVDSPRPREPRENGDFLRVVVLEMNMRRAGKLGDVSGRARIWIGPRMDKARNEQKQDAPTGRMSRAERGMGEVVASELAEAMMTDDEEAIVVRSLQADDESKLFDADVHSKVLSRSTQSSSKETVPSRWESMAA